MLPELAETVGGGAVAAAAEANSELAFDAVDVVPNVGAVPVDGAAAAAELIAENEDSVAAG